MAKNGRERIEPDMVELGRQVKVIIRLVDGFIRLIDGIGRLINGIIRSMNHWSMYSSIINGKWFTAHGPRLTARSHEPLIIDEYDY